MHTVCTHRCEMACPYWPSSRTRPTTRLDGAHLSGLLDFAGALADGTEQALVTRDEMSRMRSGHNDEEGKRRTGQAIAT